MGNSVYFPQVDSEDSLTIPPSATTCYGSRRRPAAGCSKRSLWAKCLRRVEASSWWKLGLHRLLLPPQPHRRRRRHYPLRLRASGRAAGVVYETLGPPPAESNINPRGTAGSWMPTSRSDRSARCGCLHPLALGPRLTAHAHGIGAPETPWWHSLPSMERSGVSSRASKHAASATM